MSNQDERNAKLSPHRGRIAPTQLAHIVRRTSRFDAMLNWYQTVLGARVVHCDGMLAFLTYDAEHHRIAIAQIPGLEDQPQMAAGTDHVAFTHADLGDLLYTYARLKGEGIEPYWCINHGPTTSMYYKDPDGNRVEFQVDNFPSADEANRWMRSRTSPPTRSAWSSTPMLCWPATKPANRSRSSQRGRRSPRA